MVNVDQNKASVSGQDKAVTHEPDYNTFNVSLDSLGYATVTGNSFDPPIDLLIKLIQEATKTTNGESELGQIAKENRNFIHWSDLRIVLEIVLNPLTKGINAEKTTYKAGGRVINENKLYWFFWNVKKRNEENILWDYNTEVKRWIEVESTDQADTDEITSDPNNPWNPESKYYSANEKITYYDKDNGLIIYQSGNIIWTKTGNRYYEAANGEVKQYDETLQLVTFSNGNVLNLNTLELVSADNQTTTIIKNTLPWYQEFFRKLLSDKNTQLTVLGAIVLLLVIKKKRSDEN